MKLSKLLEAGRRNSARDAAMLQQMHDGAVALGASCGTSEAADDPEMHVSEAFLEAVAMSYEDIASTLRNALTALYPGDGRWVWTRSVYDDKVIYSVDDKTTGESLYQRSYSILDGKVTFGDPIRVIAVTNYVPVSEAERQPTTTTTEADDIITTDLVPLLEKAVKKDGTATIKIIAPGQGSSGFYPADVLKRDGPKVFTEGTHVYLDHPSASEATDRPERSVKDLAGSLTGAATWQEDGAAGPGLYAPVKFIDSVAPHINDIAAISGMSIRAGGTMGTREIDGKKVRTIESIDVAHSVDVVTKPGAGGKVLDLIESARGGVTPPKPTTPPKGGTTVELQEQLNEAVKERDDARGKLTEAQQLIDKQTVELARLREQNILREANAVIAATLAEMDLHQMTRERLTKQLIANPPVKDGELDTEVFTARVTEAAKAELTYLQLSTGGTGQVRGMGGGGGGDFDASAAMIAAFKEAGYSEDVARQMAAR